MRVDRLDTQTTSLNWQVRYMYRIRHRIIKPVLITEEGGEKTCILSLTGTDACTRKGARVQRVRNTRVMYPRVSS